jgi:hypothetical protein
LERAEELGEDTERELIVEVFLFYFLSSDIMLLSELMFTACEPHKTQ